MLFLLCSPLQIGGCANLTEKYLGIDRMQAQAATATRSIASMLAGTPDTLTPHVEGGTTSQPAMVNVGRATFAAWVPEVFPAPAAVCLRCCGPPLNCLFCLPCVAYCSTLGRCPYCCCCTGSCCGGYPQGAATAEFIDELYASGMYPKNVLGWAGLGGSKLAPAVSTMARS